MGKSSVTPNREADLRGDDYYEDPYTCSPWGIAITLVLFIVLIVMLFVLPSTIWFLVFFMFMFFFLAAIVLWTVLYYD